MWCLARPPIAVLLAWCLLPGCWAAKVTPSVAPATAPTRSPDADAAGADAFVLPADAGLAEAPGADAACAAQSWAAESVPVDLVFVIDQSPSMSYRIGDRTKWSLAQEALRTFLADPRSAGLNVGLQFFPTRAGLVSCADDNACGYPFACIGGACSYPFAGFPSCAPGDYERLAVDLAALPAARERLSAALDRTPASNLGISPLGPAAQGVLKVLRQRLATQPGRRGAVVFVTDGVPSGCIYGWTGVNQIVAGLEAEQRQRPALPVYVIGIYSDSADEDAGGPAALARYAAAGGTGMAFTVKPPADVTRGFLDALDRIRAASLPCEYVIPTDKGPIDFARVNLRARLLSGEVDVPYVARAERCDAVRGGWYYDVDPAVARPARVIACPATCQSLKTNAAEIALTFGCRTITID